VRRGLETSARWPVPRLRRFNQCPLCRVPAETLSRNRTRSESAQAGVPAVAVPRVTGWHAFVLTMDSQPIQGGFHHCDARDCLNSKPCTNEKKPTHLSPAECSNYAFGDGSQFRNRSGVRPEESRRAGLAERPRAAQCVTLSAEAFAPGGAVRRAFQMLSGVLSVSFLSSGCGSTTSVAA
jgi:hypothetical protein